MSRRKTHMQMTSTTEIGLSKKVANRWMSVIGFTAFGATRKELPKDDRWLQSHFIASFDDASTT